jgi:hypothetical protein
MILPLLTKGKKHTLLLAAHEDVPKSSFSLHTDSHHAVGGQALLKLSLFHSGLRPERLSASRKSAPYL